MTTPSDTDTADPAGRETLEQPSPDGGRRIGQDLAGYRLQSVISRGGMGVVYLAEDLRLKRRAAVKLISPELAALPDFRDRFLAESEAAASLDNSHIVPIYAAGETDGELWIAMRHVDGDDLGSVLRERGPLASEEAVEICSQIADALSAAHAHGLVHRDVKPANILVADEAGKPHCYLTDFGLARGADADNSASTHLSGSVDYTAPEQVSHGSLDARTDVYSLACVLFECLAGEPPFKRPRAWSTLYAHMEEQPPSVREHRPDLPSAIDGVIGRALSKEPADRYGSAAELMSEARRALGLDGPRRLTRRHVVVATAALAVVVAAAIAVPLGVVNRGADAPAPLTLTDNSAVRIDAESGAAAGAVTLGGDPGFIAAGLGSVWVVDSRAETLRRIDPAKEAVVEDVDISDAAPVELYLGDRRITTGAGAVWLSGAFHDAGYIWKHEPGSQSVAEIARSLQVALIGARDDGVWVADLIARALVRLDPATGRTLDSVVVEDATWPTWSALDGESLWQWRADPGAEGRTIDRLDLKTGRVLASVPTDLVEINGLEAGLGGIWVLGNGSTLLHIDPSTNAVTQRLPVGRSVDDLAVGGGYVWVGSERDQTVTRVDPATGDLLPVDVGGRPVALATLDDEVWAIVRPG